MGTSDDLTAEKILDAMNSVIDAQPGADSATWLDGDDLSRVIIDGPVNFYELAKALGGKSQRVYISSNQPSDDLTFEKMEWTEVKAVFSPSIDQA